KMITIYHQIIHQLIFQNHFILSNLNLFIQQVEQEQGQAQQNQNTNEIFLTFKNQMLNDYHHVLYCHTIDKAEDTNHDDDDDGETYVLPCPFRSIHSKETLNETLCMVNQLKLNDFENKINKNDTILISIIEYLTLFHNYFCHFQEFNNLERI